MQSVGSLPGSEEGEQARSVPVVPALDSVGSQVEGQAPAAWLTWEQALYGALLLLAAALRFLALGTRPLNPVESAWAWAAWLGAMGIEAPNPPVPDSALLYTIQRFLFWLTGGGSDAWARLAPALAGTALVLVPWWLRPWLGRGPALLLAGLLALDPWLVAFSRMGDSPVLSLGLGMVVLAAMVQLRAGRTRQSWDLVLAVAAALLLISGPQSWNWWPVLLAFWFLRARPAPDLGSADPAGDGRVPAWPRPSSRMLFLTTGFGAVALLTATGGLLHVQGLGYISTSLGAWGRQLAGTVAVDYPLRWPFLRLLADQPLILVVGLAGLAYLWLDSRTSDAGVGEANRRHGGFPAEHAPTFLSLWTLWGIVLLLLPGRDPAGLLMVALPLLLATARAGALLLAYCVRGLDLREGGLVAVSLAILVITTGFWTASISKEIGAAGFDGRVWLFYLAVPVLVAFFAWWAGWRQSGKAVGLLAFGILFLWTAGNSWQLSLSDDTTQRTGLWAQESDSGVRLLASDVARLSALRALDDSEIPVLVQMGRAPDPQIGWNLRRMRHLAWVSSPAALEAYGATGGAAPLVITPGGEADPGRMPGGYLGSDYRMRRVWLPTEMEGPGPLLRWILYREVAAQVGHTESVILWASAG